MKTCCEICGRKFADRKCKCVRYPLVYTCAKDCVHFLTCPYAIYAWVCKRFKAKETT